MDDIINYDLLKGCLCWFWDRNEAKPRIGILVDYFGPESPYPFYEMDGGLYAHCKPAEYKEIKFYHENPMKSVYLGAKEKAQKKIIDTIDGYLTEESQNYIDYQPNTAVAMENDKIHVACAESEEVQNAIKEYMEILV